MFRGKAKAATRWRDVVEVILTDMGAHDGTIDEKGCCLFLYLNITSGQVLGMLITEIVNRNDLHMFCPKSIGGPVAANDSSKQTRENSAPPHLNRSQAKSSTSVTAPSPKKLGIDKSDCVSTEAKENSNGNSMRGILTLFSDEYTVLSPTDLRTPSLTHILSEAPLSGPFSIGIKQMWVNANHRRQGIAHQMLDCVRASAPSDSRCPLFVPSHEKYKICFSQPTSDGLRCALRYVASSSKVVWLYSHSSVM